MYCTRKVNEDITWVGGNDRRLAMFEGVYSIPDGVSYNSYLKSGRFHLGLLLNFREAVLRRGIKRVVWSSYNFV